MTLNHIECPKDNNPDRIAALKIQYDKLTNDWRSFNNLIWGVPTVAIAITTGILIGAYDHLGEGTWERIASLIIGSLFLFALTIEVIKKRYHMNVTSLLLKDLQKELGLDERFQFPLGIAEDIDKYLALFMRKEKKRMFADYNDPLFEFFSFSYARKYLTYVVFSAAIILAILTEWEFIYHQKLGEWTIVTGIVIGIVAIIIPVLVYMTTKVKKTKEEKKNFVNGLLRNDRKMYEISKGDLSDVKNEIAYALKEGMIDESQHTLLNEMVSEFENKCHND